MKGGSRRPVGTARLALRQVGSQLSLVLRSPTGAFFTFVVPLMVLVALNLVYGGYSLPTRPDIRFPRFYTPAMAAFAVANACYVNLLTGITLSRQQGMLKRIRGTPLPPWVYLAARATSAAVLGVLSAVAVLIVGSTTYPVPFPWAAVPSLTLSTAVGAVCFSALGLAASTLPLRPLARSFESPFLAGDTGLHGSDVAVMVAWTGVAVLVIIRSFKWEPPAGDRRRRLGGREATRRSRRWGSLEST